jgi:hypothetical protein
MTNKTSLERITRNVFEHYPHKLFISVNGYFVGSQKINAGQAEQGLNVNVPEPISFVEVFSEQGIRLLMLDVQPLPDGAIEQSEHVELSDGRTLRLSLRFGGLWPELHVAYRDESFAEALSNAPAAVAGQYSPQPSHVSPSIAPRVSEFWTGFKKAWVSPFSWTWSFTLAHRSTVFAGVATMVFVLAMLMFRSSVTPLSAAVLLDKSSALERSLAAIPGRVFHRTIAFEEHNHSTGALISRKRIDVWQNPSNKTSARRLYDEKNQLEAGEWIKSDGSRTVLEQASNGQSFEDRQASSIYSFAAMWRMSPSANEFSTIVPTPTLLKVEPLADVYILHYGADSPGLKSGVLEASLTLRSSDLRAVAQTLVVQQGTEIREFDFRETQMEQTPSELVASSIFEPDPALLGFASARPVITLPEPPPLPPPAPTVAPPALEVDVLERLDSVNALAGEQVTVTHTPQGTLSVEGIVETQERKEEILEALASLLKNPAVNVGVNTVEEAEADQRQKPPERIRIEQVELKEKAVPVAKDLRTYFVSRKDKKDMTSDQIEQEIKRYSEQVFNRSIRARLHASALNQIVASFTPSQLEAMDQTARAQWRSMVNKHAQAFWEETEILRQELEPIFMPETAKSPVPPATEKVTGDLRPFAKQLLDVAVANDEAIRKSFSVSTDDSGVVPLKTIGFWAALRKSEAMAAEMVSPK